MNQSYRIDIAMGMSAAYVDAVEISGNVDFVAVRVDDGTFYATRSSFLDNRPGAINASASADVYLRNCIVGANGFNLGTAAAIEVSSSSLDVLYSTLAANDGSGVQSISCDATTTGGVRNSIVLGADPSSIACDIAFTNSLVDTAGLGATNEVQSFSIAWFPAAASSDFHVSATGPFDGLAVWETGDPATDIDGDARPATDGVADFAGADVPM